MIQVQRKQRDNTILIGSIDKTELSNQSSFVSPVSKFSLFHTLLSFFLSFAKSFPLFRTSNTLSHCLPSKSPRRPFTYENRIRLFFSLGCTMCTTFSMTLAQLHYQASMYICLHYVAWKLYGNKFCCTHCLPRVLFCYTYYNKFSKHEWNFPVLHFFSSFPKLYANTNCLTSSEDTEIVTILLTFRGFFLFFLFSALIKTKVNPFSVHFCIRICLVGRRGKGLFYPLCNIEWFSNSK